MSAGISYRTEGAVARLVLDQPARRNALTEAMWQAIPAAVARAAADPAVRLLVVEGAGGHFAAGADISEFGTVYATPERAAAYSAAIAAALEALSTCQKPTLARVEGACVGGGCSVALACDFRIATPEARFAITPARLGLVYPLGDTSRLVASVGQAATRRLLFTGAVIEAAEALRLGLVDELLPREAQEAHILALATQLAEVSATSIGATKQMIALVARGPAAKAEAEALFLSAFASADFKEGYAAFLAKRPPDFPSAR